MSYITHVIHIYVKVFYAKCPNAFWIVCRFESLERASKIGVIFDDYPIRGIRIKGKGDRRVAVRDGTRKRDIKVIVISKGCATLIFVGRP